MPNTKTFTLAYAANPDWPSPSPEKNTVAVSLLLQWWLFSVASFHFRLVFQFPNTSRTKKAGRLQQKTTRPPTATKKNKTKQNKKRQKKKTERAYSALNCGQVLFTPNWAVERAGSGLQRGCEIFWGHHGDSGVLSVLFSFAQK